MTSKERVRDKARRIRLLILDVDGVLTDGGIYFPNEDGEEMKRFDAKDGMGVRMFQVMGGTVALVTGRVSNLVRRRAKDLNISEVYMGVHDGIQEFSKLEICRNIMKRLGVEPEETAYVGDDLVDILPMRAVGFAVAVGDASPEVKAEADYVTKAPGGRGAVRETVELILKAQNKWEEATERFIGEQKGERGGRR
ncbi:MAG: KdsC family phosphatase [bacterium]